MKEKTPGRTRPEMGTPEYEEWRKEELKRRRKRQLKERRKRLAIITVAMIVAVGASVGVGVLKGRSEKASKEKTVLLTNRKNRPFPEKKLQKQVLKIQRPFPKILSQRQSFWPVSITMTKLSIF